MTSSSSSTSVDDFFAMNAPPSYIGDIERDISLFCDSHRNGRIVLVTSGGTTVPLEHNTVRFVDNFSAGTRGAASAEHFLDNGYNVIFLYRLKSLEPYARHFMGRGFLDKLRVVEKPEVNSDSTLGVYVEPDFKPRIEVHKDFVEEMLPILHRYQAAINHCKLMCIGFTTLSEYLWLLRLACQKLANFGPKAMLYLAAAVSDFYIPADKMPEHKIQSAEGAPTIKLHLVPKMLTPIVSFWAPDAYVVSFKLETDPEILISKARRALTTYKHQLVIGNILSERKYKVTFIEPSNHYDITLDDDEAAQGLEIEEKIVLDLCIRHITHMDSFNDTKGAAQQGIPQENSWASVVGNVPGEVANGGASGEASSGAASVSSCLFANPGDGISPRSMGIE